MGPEVNVTKKLIAALTVIVVALAAGFFSIAPRYADRQLNATLARPPYAASPGARALHGQLVIADLHADSLLWDRDLLARHPDGHVDLPRLLEANVAVQLFTIVTKAPIDIRLEGNDPTSDAITWLMLSQLRPPSTWRSLTARAVRQTRAFDDAVRGSAGQLVPIRTASDLDSYLERRARDARATAGLLGIEGAHALDGDLANLDTLFDAGIRMMSPVHLADNDMAGSAHGIQKGGLTERGRELIRRMEARRMIVDLAHASRAAFDDAMGLVTRPVVISHAGVRGTCDNVRNLSDDQLRAVERTGGVVGIGFWETATCGRDAHAVARAIQHAVRVAGIDHVGLGSDFDGAVTAPFDATGLVTITDALLSAGLSEEHVRAVMGGNILRLLRTVLP